MLPVFSAASCILLVLFSLADSLTSEEKKLKLVTAGYFLATAIVWLSLFSYNFYPEIFLWFNIPLLLCFLLVPVLFYNIMELLTMHRGLYKLNLWHYAAPVALSAVLMIWSFFVPSRIQLEIVIGHGHYIPPGYEAYTLFFISKPLLRLIYGIVYFVLTLRILQRYYKKASTPASLVRKPARWVVYLMALLLMTLVASLITATVPRGKVLESFLSLVAATAVVGQHLLFTYHIIRRQYLMYVVHTPLSALSPVHLSVTDGRAACQRRQHNGQPLTRRRLDTYFRNEKPYLNMDFKITDLVEYFDLNRSTISGFINKTYGVNFTRFVNRWRLDELDRLYHLPSNQDKNKSQLIQKAGFTNMKHYRRASKTEREDKMMEPQNTQGNE